MESDIRKVIEEYIESRHRLGEQSGGSGHMGFVSYTIDSFELREMDGGNIQVNFSYTIFTETEFTYYPDNPPYKDHYNAGILLDKDLNILET